MTDPILQVEHLHMAYRYRRGWLEVLQDLSFQVAEGEFLAVVGPSGCGKTTLLRLIAGLARPVAGRVLLHGRPVIRPSREVGFVFQKPALFPWRTALENVALPLEVNGHSPREALHLARSLLRWVGLEGFEEAYPSHLSGGMAQRVVLARALIHRPSVLLLDEPFGSLDALTRETMVQELARLWEEHRLTVVMVTHSVSEAVFLADRVLVLSPRPARLVAEIPIPLPRSRDAAVLEETVFPALVRKVRKTLEWARTSGAHPLAP